MENDVRNGHRNTVAEQGERIQRSLVVETSSIDFLFVLLLVPCADGGTGLLVVAAPGRHGNPRGARDIFFVVLAESDIIVMGW